MADFSYGIYINGYNQAGAAFQQAQSQVQQVDYGVKQTSQSFDMLNWRSLMAMRGVVFGFQMALFYLTMYSQGMDRTENYTISVERAQRNYNKAVTEYGRGSEQAQNAQESLTMAVNNYNAAVTRSNIMTLAMGFQAVSMGISFMQALPAIKGMIGSLQSFNAVAEVSVMLKSALSSPWAPLGLAVGAATIAGVAYYASQQNQPKQQVNVSVTNEGILDDYLRRTGGTNAKTSGVG